MSIFKRFRSDKNNEIDEKKCSSLSQAFNKDPQKGIDNSHKYFIKSTRLTYEKFIDEVKSTQKKGCCTFSWSSPTLCGHCLDCQVTNSTCFCIPCFLEGHHDQHTSIIYYASSGSCDCGNPTFINPSGFCPKHQGQEISPDTTQMTPENRKKFITFFRAAFLGALNCRSDDKMNEIFGFITPYINMGDGLRRCAAIGIVSVCKTNFYPRLTYMTEKRVKAIIDLFGQLISDFYFLQKMSLFHYKNYVALAKKLGNCIVKKEFYDEYDSIRTYFSFSYHFFSRCSVEYVTHKEKFDWPVFLANIVYTSLDTVKRSDFEYDKNYECSTMVRLYHINSFLTSAFSMEDQHENIQKFIDEYCDVLARYEMFITFSVPMIPQNENDDGYSLNNFTTIMGNINNLFTANSDADKFKTPNNKVFSISSVVSSIYKFYETNHVGVESIMNSKKKALISTCCPLHHLFFCLLQNHKDTKTLVEKECVNQGIDFQRFCSSAIIYPLRSLAAAFQSGKFAKLNNGFRGAMRAFLTNPKNSFNGLFGLVQTLVGIAPNKEKLLETVLQTFGLFDDISEFKSELDTYDFERQSFLLENTPFEVSIFILSLLTDNSILSLDKIYFDRLRTIELLKQGRKTAEEIEKYVDIQIDNQAYSDDLIDYVERVVNKKGESFFRLKDEGDFTPFFPPIHVNNRMNLLMKFGEKLIAVSDYSELPREISLQGCFRTPSFIALTFNLLSLTDKDITTKQMGFALFVSMVRNGPKIPGDSFNVENPISIVGRDLKEVISELTKVENRLNEVNVLTINIQLGDKEPTSIIKLVQSNKQLGSLAIEKAELPSSLQMKDEKVDQRIKANKAKAAMLRERLLRDYQNRRKQFGSTEKVSKSQITKPQPPPEKRQQQQTNNNDDEDDDLESNQDFNESEIVCNVCLSGQDDIYGFPCLSLPTTLPSMINSKLHKLVTPLSDVEDTFTMNICSHHIHYKCYVQLLKEEATRRRENSDYNVDVEYRNSQRGVIAELFHCTMDRGHRNCFLPLFEAPTAQPGEEEASHENEFSMKLPILTKVAITDFIRRAYNEKATANPSIPMKSYANIVMMLEVRHRNRPDILDEAHIPILLRNLLLTIYHGLHQRMGSVKLASSFENDPLGKLIYELIKSEDPVEDFVPFVQMISSEIEESDLLYEFLRRAVIIDHFAIKNAKANGDFIDWDDVLSLSNLIERFGIPDKKSDIEIELPLFETIPLPEKFIYLCKPPYNFDIFESSDPKAVDLITGEVCYYKKTDNCNSKYLPLNEYIDKYYKGGLGMFLCLTGDNASGLLYYSSMLNKAWDKYCFYTDQFGDGNQGFKRKTVTSLSKDRLENALDALLSGNLVLY